MSLAKTRLLDRMVSDGLITAEQQEAALNVMARTGERPEEVLLEVSAVEEPQLLKYLAALHRTRFVATEKLAKAEIDRPTLEKVPKKLADRECVFPVLFDGQTSTLSIVTPDPDNTTAIQDVQIASGAKEVRAFIGRPRAVRAAILKAYNGDIHAFANLDRDAHAQFTTMMNVFERNLVSEESLAVALAKDAVGERVLTSADLEHGRKTATAARGGVIAEESYLETLNVLITLLENGRQELRGHSAQVARLMKRIGERIGVAESSRAALQVAGYCHDLGKMGTYHLTCLNVAEYEGHRTSAAKLYTAPTRLLEAVSLPSEAVQSIEHMYERYDGQGLPDRVGGKDIPLGARLLAIADTYSDLTLNPRNPFRKALRPPQACEVLQRYAGTVFDPNLVDLFKHTVTGEDLKARLLSNRHRALIIDPDPEETTVLELRLLEQGFEVVQARSPEQAFKVLERGETEIVVSEVEVPPGDGFALLTQARQQAWGQKLPWVFVTNRVARADAQRAFQLGAADFMTKPVSTDVLVAKLRQILEREAAHPGGGRGVSGSLSEMSLPDMIQVLWHGRKTGSLKIRSGANVGEIHFVDGAIFNGMYANLRGEEAVYAMLTLKQGDFVLDPNFRAPQQVIHESPEALLLEGMRRLDEGSQQKPR